MDIEQPDASSSTSSRPDPHLATFVFDPALARDDYVKLIEPEGVIHKLVQRLMEKHGGEKQVRIALFISHSEGRDGLLNPFALPSPPLKRDFTSPSAFLGSLPGYTDKFAQGFTDQVAEDSWKMFINESMMLDDDDAQPAGSYSQPANAKRSEAAMLAGVVGGLELLLRPKRTFSPSSLKPSISSMFPAGAQTLLAPMLTPPPTPPVSAPRSLIIVSLSPETDETLGLTPQSDISDEIYPKKNWNPVLDGHGWVKLAEKCKSRDIDCSLVARNVSSDRGSMGWTGLGKTIMDFCSSASPKETDIWFELPAGFEARLSGLSVDAGKSPTPPIIPSSSQATVPPSPNQLSSSLPTDPSMMLPTGSQDLSKVSQLQAQAAALRLLQQEIRQSGGVQTPQQQMALRSLLAAKSGGGLDLNHPAMQQFKHLLMLQQQQRQGQLAMNPAAAAAAGAGAAGGNPAASEQMIRAALQQQAQQQTQQVPNVAQPLPSGSGQSRILWSGELSWPANPGPGQIKNRLSLEAMMLTPGNVQSFSMDSWPREISIAAPLPMTIPEIQDFVKTNRTPCLCFNPPANDPQNAVRYQNFVTSLQNRGSMAIVRLGAPDQGAVLFASPYGPNAGERPLRLMGVVCINVPLPSRQSQSQQQVPNQTPQQPQMPVQAPQIPQVAPPQFRPNMQPNMQQQQNNQISPPLPPSLPMQGQPQQQAGGQTPNLSGLLTPTVDANGRTMVTNQQVEMIKQYASRNSISLPANFMSLQPDKLKMLIEVIKASEAKKRAAAGGVAPQQQPTMQGMPVMQQALPQLPPGLSQQQLHSTFFGSGAGGYPQQLQQPQQGMQLGSLPPQQQMQLQQNVANPLGISPGNNNNWMMQMGQMANMMPQGQNVGGYGQMGQFRQ